MSLIESTAPGLYIHIPFCRSKCAYCDFYSVTDVGLVPRFLEALCREMEFCRDEFDAFDTIYLGGGTPSLLSLGQLDALLAGIRRTFTVLPGAEATIEINPADWRGEDLDTLKDMGFNRISIGIQSFHDHELAFLGRRHNRDQALRTLEDAGRAGFTNISIDLIYSLPGQSSAEWEESLREALSFVPAHLSCYELELKSSTPLGERLRKGEISMGPEETRRDFFVKTSEILEASGYVHYEVSNFARGMNRASRHNQKYWDHTPYLGLGPSAHSFRDGRRWWNRESVDGYIRDLEAGKRPVRDSERLGAEQLRMEALFLGLRTGRGLDRERFRLEYGCDLVKEHGPVLEEWEKEGLIVIGDAFIRPTLAGMAVADSLALL